MRPASVLRTARRISLLIAIGLFLVVAAACSAQPVESGVAPEVGRQAPSFEARLVGGDTARIDDFLGEGIVLNFWATWCVPCQRELPLLEQVARQGDEDGVTVVAVNMGETEEEILAFLADFDVSFPIVLDADGSISRLYAVPVLPMTFFIDGNRVIRYRRAGELREGHIAEGLSRIAAHPKVIPSSRQ